MGDGRVRVELPPDARREEPFLVLVDEVPFRRWPVWVQPIWAAGIEMASYVEVALTGYTSVIQTLNRLLGIEVEEDVVVPCESVRVEEENRVRKIVVVVDYVC
jgi:hypothetical protein